MIAVDRFSKWPKVKICKTAETKEVISFLTNKTNLFGIPEKIKPDRGGAYIQKNTKNFARTETKKSNTVRPDYIQETER